MALSNAVGVDRISRIVGYKIIKGNFSETTSNLPQRIAILGEANTANQGTLDLTPYELQTAQEAGERYGYGSPIYQIMKILRPPTGGGVGGVPVVAYPQASAGATAASRSLTVAGVATKNGRHTVVIAGRARYNFDVNKDDTAAEVATKIAAAITNVFDAPVTAEVNGVTPEQVDITAKWEGLTSEDLKVTVDTNDVDLGTTYVTASLAAGAGTPSVTTALDLFGANWNTIVINSYGSPAFTELEEFNGVPDPDNPTGRYLGTTFKPFIALAGSLLEDPSTLTDITARKDQVTNAICPAPNSPAFAFEAASNVARLWGRIATDTPHLDLNGKSYPDMPIPSDSDIGTNMSTFTGRDALVKGGSSTVDLVAGAYQIQAFITTYHPDGEDPAQFRYGRNLMLDFNVRYGYYLLEQENLVDHAIAADSDVVDVQTVVKPKQWKQVVDKYAEDLGRRALIADVPFMQDSIVVELSATNPDRLETFFKYKRSGIARISSTTAEAGFNFGS